MKPTKNRRFCHDCRKYKMLFESESKADNFIKFNSEEIKSDSGYAPNRSYYCRSCNCWHVTSSAKQYDETLPSLTDRILDAYRSPRITKFIHNDKEQLDRANDLMTTIAALIKEKDYHQCVSLLQQTNDLLQSITDDCVIIKYKQALLERYKKLLNRTDRRIRDGFTHSIEARSYSTIELRLEEAQGQYNLGHYKAAAHHLRHVCPLIRGISGTQRVQFECHLRKLTTMNNLKLGVEAVEKMQEPDKKVLVEECDDAFIKIDQCYTYGEYHECVLLIQYVKRIYDVLLTVEGAVKRKEKIKSKLYRYMDAIYLALKTI